MKFSYWIVSAMMAAGQHATAADTNERTSPVDSNPACMDRTTDASSGDCLIKDKGRPRHTYPPPAPRGGDCHAGAGTCAICDAQQISCGH